MNLLGLAEPGRHQHAAVVEPADESRRARLEVRGAGCVQPWGRWGAQVDAQQWLLCASAPRQTESTKNRKTRKRYA